jgi:hypothetical protein
LSEIPSIRVIVIMTSSARAAALFLAVSALLLTGSPAPAQGVWTTVPSPNEVPGRNFLLGADASDASHVWAVGRLIRPDGTGFQSRVLQHDGTAWRPASLSGFPGDDELVDVDAVSSNEAWAAGTSFQRIGRSSTLVARWDGSAWTPELTPNGNRSSLNNLAGVTATGGTVWAVGAYIIEPGSANRRGLILQRTEGSWRIVPTPRVQVTELLDGVDATGPTDAWAVGWGGNDSSAPAVPIALRWDGTSWQSVPLPSTESALLYTVDALSPSNVWVAGETYTGGSGRQPYVAHFDGTSWRRVATPTIANGGRLTDIVALSPSNIVAVGTAGGGWISLVLHWNGSSWMREAAPDAGLTGAAAVGPNTFWAVGHRFDLSAYAERTFTMVRT